MEKEKSSIEKWILYGLLVIIGGGNIGSNIFSPGGIEEKVLETLVSEAAHAGVTRAYNDRQERFTEPKAEFLHKLDTDHKNCIVDAIENDISRNNAELNCSIKQLVEISIRQME